MLKEAQNVKATVGDSQVELSWDPVIDAVNYIVEASVGGPGQWKIVDDNVQFTFYTHSGLTNNVVMFYRIYAKDATGSISAPSTMVLATPQAPKAPDLDPSHKRRKLAESRGAKIVGAAIVVVVLAIIGVLTNRNGSDSTTKSAKSLSSNLANAGKGSAAKPTDGKVEAAPGDDIATENDQAKAQLNLLNAMTEQANQNVEATKATAALVGTLTTKVNELQFAQAQPATEPPAPAEEEEADEEDSGDGEGDAASTDDPCEPCAEQEEPLTLEGVAADLKQFKKSQYGQWDSIGRLNTQMKEVKADIAAIRLDISEIKKLDTIKVSDLPGMPAESVAKVDGQRTDPTITIKTVDHPDPPPAKPRTPKVTRQ